MKIIHCLFATFTVLFSAATLASELTSAKIKEVSINPITNDIYVQTTPAFDLAALGCGSQTSGLLIPKDNADGLKATISMLLSAQAMQYPVNVTGELGGNGKCQLTKLTVKAG